MHKPKPHEITGVLDELCHIASEMFNVDAAKISTRTTIAGLCGGTSSHMHHAAGFICQVRLRFPMLPRTSDIVREVDYKSQPDARLLRQLPEGDEDLVGYLQFARQVTLEQLAQLIRMQCSVPGREMMEE